MLLKVFVLWTSAALCLAQAPQSPDLGAQHAAMDKLQFLLGAWSGNARIWRSPENVLELTQTEQVTYKLNGLILMVEGVGVDKTTGKPSLQALGLISFDDLAGVYHMRAFNDGRWLESSVELDESRRQLHWGFTLGQIRTNSTLRLDDNGTWTETHEVSVNAQPYRQFMDVSVVRKK
jgi:hypothetical protein